MGKIWDFFKREIKLNTEYYESLKSPLPDELSEAKAFNAGTGHAETPMDYSVPVKEQTPINADGYIIYYVDGHVVNSLPPIEGSYYEHREIINAATQIISDGRAYDLTNIQSILSIEVPSYSTHLSNNVSEELGFTGYLEYVLRMRSGLYWSMAEYDLAIACLEKATELMKYSDMGWPVKDFFRIVNELNDLGRFKKAKKWEEWIKRNVPNANVTTVYDSGEGLAKENFSRKTQKECRDMGTDLVEVGDSHAVCEVCAKYRKRVYSLSGKSAEYPKFPKDFHWGCGMRPWMYMDGISRPSFECDDVVACSNRPFVDDRTEEERQNYAERLAKMGVQEPLVRPVSLTRIIYYRLRVILPDDAPKSLSGFSRMRNANSKNYQALVEKAKAAGFVFPETIEEVEAWGL